MALFREILYDIREGIKEFSDDTETDDRYLTYLYNIKRAKYLRQELNNYQRTVDLSIQQTFCVDLKLIGGSDCGDECPKLLRSTVVIPKPLELHSKVAITRVKPTSKIAVPFNFISKNKIPYLGGAPFSKSLYSFLDDDDFLYVYSLSDSYKLLDCISITGVFSNPLDLVNYSNCCGCSTDTSACFDPDTTEYPLQPHYIDLIRKEIIVDILERKGVQEDKINDDNDNING